MQFSNLLRMMDASQGNLKTELDLFHEFGVENKGAISLADMTNGLRRVVTTRGLADPFVKALLKGVRAYHERGIVALWGEEAGRRERGPLGGERRARVAAGWR